MPGPLLGTYMAWVALFTPARMTLPELGFPIHPLVLLRVSAWNLRRAIAPKV